MKTGPKPRPVLERFIEKVVEGPNGCWLWSGAVSECGYGRFSMGGHKSTMFPAHRIAWLLFRGEMPPSDKEVAHRCDVRTCVNPEHLWLATHAENMKDMYTKGRNRPGPVFGDRNGSRTRPDRRPRGDNHWTRRRNNVG